MELAWFRKPSGDDEGTLNLTYLILDLPVIRGRASDPAVTGAVELDFAGLLEQVGALAGAFRGLGVTPGQAVSVKLDDPVRELLALLATLRLGAFFIALDRDEATLDPCALLVTDSLAEFGEALPEAVIVSGIEPQDPTRDVTWDVVLKAGRTDPAGCEPVAPRSPAYQAETDVDTIDVASDKGRIGTMLTTLLAGNVVHLDPVHPDTTESTGDAS